ncbi:MAG: tyrosine-type recombinase/integrase [Ktedonobacteraceae bacterium]|nr:tyrosine-type recombinase/integrase [Ktedonobacteraceae bacterium]
MNNLQKSMVPEVPISSWAWPLDGKIYDRTPALSPEEQEALAAFLLPRRHLAQMISTVSQQGKLARLMQPLSNVFAAIEGDEPAKIESTHLLLRMCAREGQPFWAWEHSTWLRVLGTSLEDFFMIHKPGNQTGIRQYVIAAAYLLGCFRDLPALGGIEMVKLAYKVFGRERLEANLAPVVRVNEQWGYSQGGRVAALRSLVAEVFLLNGNPDIREITLPFLQHLYEAMEAVVPGQAMVYRLSRILVSLEILECPLTLRGGLPAEKYKMERERGIAPEWVEWVERWFTTTTRPLPHRRDMRLDLLRMGRWLAQHHPEVLTPADFTRELAAEVVAAVNEMTIGEFSCENLNVPLKHPGRPWSAGRKHGFLGVLRRCFSEMIDWGWMERRFNPQRVFATPRHLKHQFRVAPRPISDDLWAKLLWAGLNLRAEDCPVQGNHRHHPEDEETEQLRSGQDSGSFYPLEMLRALAVVWLFAGLRSDELSRLRVGCARQQTVVTGEQPEESKPLCLLDIPVHKTGRAFTKPVDPLVGEAIAAWEAVRPAQPDLIDPKTGEQVQFLFCYRAKRLSKTYLNKTLIPVLCQRAGIPRADARGLISSHRARSTIASQLFNAREPMTLFELQAWLGHTSPATTQHYVLTSPTKLAQAYKDAGYFSRNVRAIEVLIDQNAITSGTAASGSPWRYYDLGHGWCSYEFFDQCPHRMACARCDFYVPKESDRGLWLQTRDGLLKLLQEIPLSDEERAAVDGDVQALNRLLERLKEVPTPGELQKVRQPFIPVSDVVSVQKPISRMSKEAPNITSAS